MYLWEGGGMYVRGGVEKGQVEKWWLGLIKKPVKADNLVQLQDYIICYVSYITVFNKKS